MLFGESTSPALAGVLLDSCMEHGCNFFDTAEMYPVSSVPGLVCGVCGFFPSRNACQCLPITLKQRICLDLVLLGSACQCSKLLTLRQADHSQGQGCHLRGCQCWCYCCLCFKCHSLRSGAVQSAEMDLRPYRAFKHLEPSCLSPKPYLAHFVSASRFLRAP